MILRIDNRLTVDTAHPRTGQAPAALTELGTIPALIAGTDLSVVYSLFGGCIIPVIARDVEDCRHSDARSGALLGALVLPYSTT